MNIELFSKYLHHIFIYRYVHTFELLKNNSTLQISKFNIKFRNLILCLTGYIFKLSASIYIQ